MQGNDIALVSVPLVHYPSRLLIRGDSKHLVTDRSAVSALPSASFTKPPPPHKKKSEGVRLGDLGDQN